MAKLVKQAGHIVQSVGQLVPGQCEVERAIGLDSETNDRPWQVFVFKLIDGSGSALNVAES